jgi:hypothetical protein
MGRNLSWGSPLSRPDKIERFVVAHESGYRSPSQWHSPCLASCNTHSRAQSQFSDTFVFFWILINFSYSCPLLLVIPLLMMSCLRPRYGGYSALRGFFVRRSVLYFNFCNFCLQFFSKLHIGQTHCRLHSTSYSDRPTVPQHHEAAPGHPARWIGYDGDRSCFIRHPRRSSSQSRFIITFLLFFTTFTTILLRCA